MAIERLKGGLRNARSATMVEFTVGSSPCGWEESVEPIVWPRGDNDQGAI